MTDHIIADLDIRGPFSVYDTASGHWIFSFLDPAGPGDIPPDIACLPVLRVYFTGPLSRPFMQIETEVLQ